MRILLIRHGEPDYAIDGLTEKGKREVALLAKKLAKEKIDKIYSSPRGRAMLTAEPTCEALGMEMEILPFMREFNVKRISLPYMEKPAIPWDILPAYINEKPHAYDPKLWQETDFIKRSEVYEEYLSVCRGQGGAIGQQRSGKPGGVQRALGSGGMLGHTLGAKQNAAVGERGKLIALVALALFVQLGRQRGVGGENGIQGIQHDIIGIAALHAAHGSKGAVAFCPHAQDALFAQRAGKAAVGHERNIGHLLLISVGTDILHAVFLI